MKIIYNRYLPFGDFFAINLCGWLFVKAEKGTYISDRTLNHEKIHSAQMREMWYVGFYLWYFVEWFYQWVVHFIKKDMRPYYFITMEQEAYDNDDNLTYLDTRQLYAWRRYIGKWIKY